MVITNHNYSLDKIDLDEEDAQELEQHKSDLYYRGLDYIYKLDEAYYYISLSSL